MNKTNENKKSLSEQWVENIKHFTIQWHLKKNGPEVNINLVNVNILLLLSLSGVLANTMSNLGLIVCLSSFLNS